MEFIENYPLSALSPADYNPRKITPEAFEVLKSSIKKFGVIKPVIVNGDKGVLTAGHQRTKAMKALGMTHTPAVKLKGIVLQDEIMFNLFHNRAEYNKSHVQIKGYSELPYGYSFVDNDKINVAKFENAPILNTIGRLITKYGEFGSVVIDEHGTVIENSEYACSVKMLKRNLLVYKLKQEVCSEFKGIIAQDFGQYNYDSLGIKAYNQTFCQMHRLSTAKEGGRQNSSTTYENIVLPRIENDKRLIDFGAGECAYVKMLQKKNYKAFAYEPHPKVGNDHVLDITKVVGFIKGLEIDVAKNGLYDYVVLDSVINSVTSAEFEDYVLTVCNGLLKKEGTFFIGTRSIDKIEKTERSKSAIGKARYVEFLDENNFSATFRNGVWTMQKFHSVETLRNTLLKYFAKVEMVRVSKQSSMHYAVCQEPRQFEIGRYQEALDVEFNMEYPNNYRHNKHEKLVSLLIDNLSKR